VSFSELFSRSFPDLQTIHSWWIRSGLDAKPAPAYSKPADNPADIANGSVYAPEEKDPLPPLDAIVPDPHTTTTYTPSIVDTNAANNSKNLPGSPAAVSISLFAPARGQPTQIHSASDDADSWSESAAVSPAWPNPDPNADAT